MDNPAVDYVQDSFVAKIKQAFAEAGYRHNFAAQVFDHEVDKKIERLGLMTGQEFYSRFENLVSEAKKDIKFNGVDIKVRLTSKAYLLLAKKAAGLKNAK
jgi:DNA-binding LacI/PurR family transcriptional regulator